MKKTFKFRSMIYTLARRDLKVKYSQTSLGILWTLIQPLTALIIFSIFFGGIMKLDTNNLPYPLFAFTGMVTWFFFSQMVNGAGLSLAEGQHLIKRIYFPRIIFLLSKVLVAFIEFGIAMVVLLITLIATDRFSFSTFFYFPAFVLLAVVSALSIAIWLSALTIKYRDLQHTVPYLVGFAIWLTPVFYPVTIVPAQFEYLLYLNPMAAVVAGTRWSLAGGESLAPQYWLSLIPVALLWLSGLDYFRRVEATIADYI